MVSWQFVCLLIQTAILFHQKWKKNWSSEAVALIQNTMARLWHTSLTKALFLKRSRWQWPVGTIMDDARGRQTMHQLISLNSRENNVPAGSVRRRNSEGYIVSGLFRRHVYFWFITRIYLITRIKGIVLQRNTNWTFMPIRCSLHLQLECNQNIIPRNRLFPRCVKQIPGTHIHWMVVSAVTGESPVAAYQDKVLFKTPGATGNPD